ncbi:ATP-binding protein [Luteimonas sp. JM171]|uniref:hybrid sensor histidine kinase/response regulator n=1 Tax=Luteimonas sp. JM171 TaxID=1896164 RepID=UPI0008579B23|nr:hybrid sensor histidine kinase/response regulator [Luteimonas sp. JM171]AOH36263.1 hypothetical protein BGP89_07785 [Luteimonas sp. JM171]
MESILKWVLLAALVLAPGAAHAAGDVPRPRQVSMADGLPSNQVNDMVEDAQGFLWVATSDGLARYDGTGFQVWQIEHGLSDSFVWSLDIDSQGRIWLGTALAGLMSYDPRSDAFASAAQSGVPDLEGEQVWTVAVDAEDSVWFGTASNGLYRRHADGRIEHFLPVAGDGRSLPSGSVSAIEIAPDGTLWIGTRNGVVRWTGQDFEPLPAGLLPDGRVNVISFAADGTMWAGTAGGVVQRNPDGSVERLSWGADVERRVTQVLGRDSRGDFWLDIRAGLGFATKAGSPVRVVPLYSESSRGEVRPYWAGLLEDREGGVWLLSGSHGLWYVPADWRRFAIHVRRVGDLDTVGNATVQGAAPAAGGGMWLVGSSGVLDRFDPETGEVERVLEDVGQGVVLNRVLEDSRGMVWVGYSAGLVRLDPRSGELQRWRVEQPADALPARMAVDAIAEDPDGRIWLLVGDSRVQVRDAHGRVLGDYARGNGTGLASNVSIRALVIGPDGRPWLGTAAGLRRLAAAGDRWEPVPGADEGVVTAVAVRDGRVWATGTGELRGWRWDGDRLQPALELGPGDGLPLVTFRGVVADGVGALWLTSTRGLVRVDPDGRVVRTWTLGDGLPSQDMRNPPVLDPVTGLLLVGTPDGLVVFDPVAPEKSMAEPNLVITRAQVRGRPPFALDAPITLEHGDRDLRVEARLLSYSNPSAHHYRFRLAGYDDDWVDVGPGGERVFSQLPSGNWSLDVVARNGDNLWSPVATLGFRVAPPWWQTPGAIALWIVLALALAAAAALAYRARLRRRSEWQLAEHKRELAEQASLAKTRFLATLGHEVRTPMTGVLGMSELLLGTRLEERQRRYAESIHDAGDHLLRLLNDALDLARIEAGKLHFEHQPFNLHQLVEECRAMNAPLARQRGLEFRSVVGEDVPGWVVGDIVRVRQILLNLVGNAIKFTSRGHVELGVHRGEGDTVRFVVTDTGPGLNAQQRERLFRRFEQVDGPRTGPRYGGSGLGLAICQELAAGMGGRISVDSAPGRGSRFEVELPLPSTAAAPDSPVPAPAPAPPLTLLLVEDDPTVAEVIGGLLRRQGHAVTHAAHALAALAALTEAPPDAALLDLDLPGLDGHQLARQFRAQGYAGTLIAITARADADSEPQALSAGFDRFVRKPLTGAILAEALAGVAPAAARGG